MLDFTLLMRTVVYGVLTMGRGWRNNTQFAPTLELKVLS